MTSAEKEFLLKIYKILISGRIDEARKELEKLLSIYSDQENEVA